MGKRGNGSLHGTSEEEQIQQDILVPPQGARYCCVHGVSRPNIQSERREAAAADVRFVPEPDGCLPSAPLCGLGVMSFLSQQKGYNAAGSKNVYEHNQWQAYPSDRPTTCSKNQIVHKVKPSDASQNTDTNANSSRSVGILTVKQPQCEPENQNPSL